MKLADAWRGDRYRLSATSDSEVHLIWEIRLATPEAAEALLKSALSAASALAGAAEDPAAGTILNTPEDRFVVMHRSAPDRVRFINAATKEAATALAP